MSWKLNREAVPERVMIRFKEAKTTGGSGNLRTQRIGEP